MRGPRPRASHLLLALGLLLLVSNARGQDGKQEKPAEDGGGRGGRAGQGGRGAGQGGRGRGVGQGGRGGQGGGPNKPFTSPQNRPARDYTAVDPSFKATLEGSMTGGEAQLVAETKLTAHAHSRLESLLRGAKTDECRQEITKNFQHYMGAMALERALPFEGEKIESQCTDPNDRPEIPESGLIDADDVRLVYVILAHEEPAQVARLVNTLDDTPGREESRTWFIVHVDSKADDMHQELLEVFKGRANVIIMEEGRLDVAWGGFNVVQASLNAVQLALDRKLPFHWLWILSGTTYPIASNDAIREKLSSHHPESFFMESRNAVHDPATTSWHYFVECDSALHRIGRNVQPRAFDMYVGSQWLAIPPSAARWLMEDKELVPKYTEYAKHIVIADENFLPTVFRNSPLCSHRVASNLVHVQFDKYEHTLDREDRRMDKCLMPNPDHCGRSPAMMTLDYLAVLEHSEMLFARKFDPKDTNVFDVLDRVRAGEQPWRKGPVFNFVAIQSAVWRARGGDEPMCFSLDDPPARGATTGSKRANGKQEARMAKCSNSDHRQVFKLGPCSSDGHLELGEGGMGFMKSTRGGVSGRNPSCSFTSARGACLDLLGEAQGPGSPAITFKCHNRWNQFFSFGEGDLAGHIISTVPSHLAMADKSTGGAVCLEAVVSDGGGGMVIMTAQCSADSPAQKFNVVQLKPLKPPPKADGRPVDASPVDASPVEKVASASSEEEECTGPEGTCPAKAAETA